MFVGRVAEPQKLVYFEKYHEVYFMQEVLVTYLSLMLVFSHIDNVLDGQRYLIDNICDSFFTATFCLLSVR